MGNSAALLYSRITIRNEWQEGVIFLLNTVPFIVTSKLLWRIINNTVRTIALSLISLFAIISIPTLIGLDIGLYIWVIEALLMVYLGYHLKLPTIVKEGYTVFYLSIISLIWELLGLLGDRRYSRY